MGTSTRNKGQSGHTPLVPSWLDDRDENIPPGEQVEWLDPVNQPIQPDPVPSNADSNRFRGSRSSFTHYINGGGRDGGALRGAVSRYVSRSLGGSSNATKRLGSARNSTARLYGVLNTLYSGGGVREIARQLSLDNLEGLSATVFFLRIAEFVCPDGGPNDEGMARSAYFDAIAENISILDKPTEALTSEECTSILQHFMCKVIMEHIVNDIANKIIVLPKDIDTVSHIEDDVEQMIKQSVADAFVEVNKNDGVITNTKAQEITDAVYQETYEILEGLGD